MDKSIPENRILDFSINGHEKKLEACREIDRRNRFGVPVKSVEYVEANLNRSRGLENALKTKGLLKGLWRNARPLWAFINEYAFRKDELQPVTYYAFSKGYSIDLDEEKLILWFNPRTQ